MEGYFLILIAPGQKRQHQIQFSVLPWTFIAFYPSAEVQSVYSTALVDRAVEKQVGR